MLSRKVASRRPPVRLVQPFEDDDDGSARAAASRVDEAASVTEQLDASFASSRLTPIPLSRAHRGDHERVASLETTQTLPSLGSCSLHPPALPPFSASTAGAGTMNALGTNTPPPAGDQGVHHDHAHRSRGLAESTGSRGVDRLAALYAQFQGAALKDAHAEGRATPVRPSASPQVDAGCASQAHVRQQQVPSQQDRGADASPSPLRPPRLKETGGAPRTGGTAAPARRPTPARTAPPSSSPATRATPARATVELPPSLSTHGIPALMHVAVRVWAALGFCDVRPSEGGVTAPAPSGAEDVEALLVGLEAYLRLHDADTPGPTSAAELAAATVLIRNGLWRVLFNAVFYCLSVLDAHRRRRHHLRSQGRRHPRDRGPLSAQEAEVSTGGAEDAYEVVYGSSSSSDDDVPTNPVAREAPVRLLWRFPGEAEAERRARGACDPLPSDSVLWSLLPPSSGGTTRVAQREAPASSVSEAQSERAASVGQQGAAAAAVGLAEAYGGRLRTPLPIADWYFVVRCLAQVGYRRDVFYLQTPFSASPHELLLALLWLTQQYRLLAVAEYVELNRRYEFLLQYHIEDTRDATTARERLLHRLGHASVWPPVSFDESATIAGRLAQLERCLGPASSTGAAATPSTGPSRGTLHVRRLMAARRLLSLSLNRLHHALQRQAEQATQLGLHSPLDAQLCRKEHDALYEEVLAGFAHVQATEARLRMTADCLARAGSLVAFLLRYDEVGVSAAEVLEALEEDDATWLSTDAAVATADSSDDALQRHKAKGGGGEAARWQRAVQRGQLRASVPSSALLPEQQSEQQPAPSSASLAASVAGLSRALSTFRANRVRATLTETWRRLLRRSHVAPHTVAPEELRFLLDVEAQQVQEARVRENMAGRYSLQAALAAEVAVLGFQRQQRQRSRSPSSSPARGKSERAAHGRRQDSLTQSSHVADSTAEAAVRPVEVLLPPLDLVTNAAAAYAQLRAEEDVYGPVALSSAEVQLTEVGEPAVGSTTSARLELERLAAWEAQLDEQLRVREQTAARVERCKTMLHTLYHHYGLRMATPVAPPPAAEDAASKEVVH